MVVNTASLAWVHKPLLASLSEQLNDKRTVTESSINSIKHIKRQDGTDQPRYPLQSQLYNFPSLYFLPPLHYASVFRGERTIYIYIEVCACMYQL